MSQTRIAGEEFEIFNGDIESVQETLTRITNDGIFNRFGEDGIPDPSDIEVTPVHIDEPTFIVRAWHETGGVDAPARMQEHDFSFTLTLGREDMFLHTEDERQYRLNTREAFFFAQVGGLAFMKSLMSTPPPADS